MVHQPTILDRTESVERYQKGGYHPIHIEDTLDGDRYHVIHKLGSGGSSTVWLARDNSTQRLVSLKSLTANASRDDKDLKMLRYLDDRFGQSPGRDNINSITNTFRIEGPNGMHKCDVSQVDSPSMAQLIQIAWQVAGSRQLRGALTRRLAKQLAEAVYSMHSAGMVHGGL